MYNLCLRTYILSKCMYAQFSNDILILYNQKFSGKKSKS